MKKKLISLLLTLVMVLSMALPVSAEEETTSWTAEDFTYGEISQDLYPAADTSDITTYSGIGITGFSESGTEKIATCTDVVFPSKDTEGNTIVGIAANAFKSAAITSIKLPEDANEWIIGASAFMKCAMTSVDLSNVVYVGGNAFQQNTGLTSVTFNEDIWLIGNSAFGKCALTSVVFPETTTHALNLDNMAFAINKLEAVKLPSNVEKLHKWVFLQNTGLETVSTGTTAEKKGGVVYMLTSDMNMLSTTSSMVCHVAAGTSNVQKFIYSGAVGEAEGRLFDSGKNALVAVEAGTGVILDVRANERRADLQLEGSLHQPLFTIVDGKNKVTTLADTLAADFLAFVADNADLADKTIYILCNSGASGAEAATRLLLTAGYPMDKLVTITNGAKDMDIVSASTVREQYISGSVAVDVALNPSDHADEVVIDVRAAELYATGHLKRTLSLPLFTRNGSSNVPTTLVDDLANAFTTYVKGNADLANKKIYILCNSGQTGAKNAAKLLYLAGYSLDNVYTIEGGAKGTDTDKSVPENLKFVTAEHAVSVIEDKDNYQIIDVRAAERHAVGHLKNSISLPLFRVNESGGNTVVTDYDNDELAKAYMDYLATADTNKTIYILCNGGMSGVDAAFALAEKAGYTGKVLGIDYGAGGETVKANLRFVTAARVLSVLEDESSVVIDVRAKELNAAGHIEGSISLPLFTWDGTSNTPTTLEDELAENFLAYVKDNKDYFADKTVYILCNSGQTGVKNAFALAEKAGLEAGKVFGITGGYNKNQSIQDIAVTSEVTVSAKLSSSKVTYTGNKLVPTLKVTDSTGKALVAGTDYVYVVYNSKGTLVTTPKSCGKYTVKVTYRGEYIGNAQSTLTYTILPKRVTNLKAKLTGYDDVKLTWTKATGATGYYVYYKKSTTSSYSAKYRKIVTGNTVTIKNLADGVKYNFKVVPYYGSDKVSSLQYTVQSKTTLKKVTGVKISRTGKKVKASWTNINGETGYQISRSAKKAGTNVIKTCPGVNVKTKTFTISTAKKYYYKVRAYKVEDGKKVFGPWSAVVYK